MNKTKENAISDCWKSGKGGAELGAREVVLYTPREEDEIAIETVCKVEEYANEHFVKCSEFEPYGMMRCEKLTLSEEQKKRLPEDAILIL